MWLYHEFLVQFLQAALRSYFLFGALRYRHITVEDAGSYNGASIPGFPSREVYASCTPQLGDQKQRLQTGQKRGRVKDPGI